MNQKYIKENKSETLYRRAMARRFERMFSLMMVVQYSLERLMIELIRDKEERFTERRVSEERNFNVERYEGGIKRVNLSWKRERLERRAI